MSLSTETILAVFCSHTFILFVPNQVRKITHCCLLVLVHFLLHWLITNKQRPLTSSNKDRKVTHWLDTFGDISTTWTHVGNQITDSQRCCTSPNQRCWSIFSELTNMIVNNHNCPWCLKLNVHSLAPCQYWSRFLNNTSELTVIYWSEYTDHQYLIQPHDHFKV